MNKEEITNNGNKAFIREVLDGGKANNFVVGYATCAYEYEKRIADLETQIEKMKCCPNCDFFEKARIFDYRFWTCHYDKECKNKDHWKLRR